MLNMARRQCLRLITVDETTVSSSRSSSSSRLLLLRYLARVFVASVHRTSLILPLLSFSPVFLSRSPPHRVLRDVLNILFSFTWLLFFSSGFSWSRFTSFCSFGVFLFSSTPSPRFFFFFFSLLVSPSSSPLYSTPDRSSFGLPVSRRACFLLLSHTSNTRATKAAARADLDSTFRIVIEREHDR